MGKQNLNGPGFQLVAVFFFFATRHMKTAREKIVRHEWQNSKLKILKNFT
jgi:hypothetical protein